MCRNTLVNVIYEFVVAYPAVLYMPFLSYMYGLYDGRLVAVQLLFCLVLLPGLVQNSTQHTCVVSNLDFSHFFFFFVDLCVVYRYDRIDTAIVWKISRFLLSVTSDIYMIDKLPIASHACMLTSVLFAFMLGPMPPTARSRLGSRYSARAVIIGRRTLVICVVYVCHNFCEILSTY